MTSHRSQLVFSTSIDGSRAEVHDRRRGLPGAFERTTRAVRLLSERGLNVRVSMATDEETWDDVEPTLLLARQLGAFAFSYSPIMPFGRGKKDYRLWNRDVRDVYETDQRLKSQYKNFIHVLAEESVVDLELPGGCGAGHRSYAMDTAGRIRPCVTFDENMAVFGSVETQSLPELFRNDLVDAFANVIPPNPEICGSCQYRFFCQGCALRALVGAQWLEHEPCAWIEHPANRRWADEVEKNSLAAV